MTGWWCAHHFRQVRVRAISLAPVMNRRSFLGASLLAVGCRRGHRKIEVDLAIRAAERPRVLRAAEAYLSEQPITITASASPRSAGGAHDYFSEADYWWP